MSLSHQGLMRCNDVPTEKHATNVQRISHASKPYGCPHMDSAFSGTLILYIGICNLILDLHTNSIG